MAVKNSARDRIAALDILNDHVPEIRGQLQFLDFLVRAVMTDLERYQAEADSGTRIFLKQLILMHLHHIGQNGGQTGALSEFSEAVHHWLDSEDEAFLTTADTQSPQDVQELIKTTIDTLNWSGGNV